MVAQVLDAPSGADDGANPQSELMAARVAADTMNPLWGPARAGASAAQAAQADLAIADNIQTAYLLPLKIFDSAIAKVTNVWALPLNRNRTNPVG